MKKWQKVSTLRTIHFGTYYHVDVDHVITPGGKNGEYSVVRMHPFSIIIPIDRDGRIYFVKQHRYTTDHVTIELPMGNSDGEDLLFAAKRELEEEVGLVSDEWMKVGTIQVANGIADIIGHVYIARNVCLADNPRIDPLDADLFEIMTFSLQKAKEGIAQGMIDDVDTVAAIAQAVFGGHL